MSTKEAVAIVSETVFEVSSSSPVYSEQEGEDVMIKVKGNGDMQNKLNGKKPGTADNTNKKKN